MLYELYASPSDVHASLDDSWSTCATPHTPPPPPRPFPHQPVSKGQLVFRHQMPYQAAEVALMICIFNPDPDACHILQ